MAKTPKGPPAGSDATVFMPREEEADTGPAGRIKIGSVLNAIYEVRRLIARGGMGEVYEGVNVNTDERVAIKVILGHLAEDPKVLAMFRREAQTLTRLNHKALVQYRVLAQEPTLGVLYIVTEYIDGLSLNEVIGEIQPEEHDLLRLTRRLAEGLGAAHDLGAIHRDMSPDNVLLPNGRLDDAKIIDFGIAKDLEASQGTIIGEGFAGKLAYVAPEQFGDFGRDIGPWTDIYSLALVMLAVASGRAVNMGTTLVEAVDRRRAKPDLSALPPNLRPIFGKMLEPDPKNRFRSMAEVVHALDALAGGPGAGAHHGRPPVVVLAAAGAAVVGLVAFAIVMLAPSSKTNGPGASPAAVQAAADATARGVSCAWLTDQLSQASNSVQVQLAGAAGDPSGAAAQVWPALTKIGAKIASVDASQVKGLPPAACDLINAVSQFRAPVTEAKWIQPQAPTFAAAANPLCNNDPAQAVSVITLTPPAAKGQDLALFRLDDTGGLTRVFASLAEAKSLAGSGGTGYRLEKLGDKGWRVSLCEKTSGLKGALAISGKPPLDFGLPSVTAGGDPTAGVAGKITAAGKAQGFVTQVAWYEVQGAVASSVSESGAASSSSAAASSSAPAAVVHHHRAASAEGAAPSPGGGGGGSSPVF